ncbi:MAG: hypothetical protein HQL08_10725 [Nitrospirae bacterium]|nr:hypothetical protein [Nitrospirota bacterium]
MDKSDAYTFDMNDTVLEFQTTSFTTEKGSILHSGVYNRETAAMLAAGAFIILLGFFFASSLSLSVSKSAGVLVLFILSFLFFRTFVFPEAVLRVIIDRKNNIMSIISRAAFQSRKLEFPLSDIEDMREDCMEIVPENPDEVSVVKKIALQHGSVIPGFGETAVRYTVSFELRNAGGLPIFSSTDVAAAGDVMEKFKNYIER